MRSWQKHVYHGIVRSSDIRRWRSLVVRANGASGESGMRRYLSAREKSARALTEPTTSNALTESDPLPTSTDMNTPSASMAINRSTAESSTKSAESIESTIVASSDRSRQLLNLVDRLDLLEEALYRKNIPIVVREFAAVYAQDAIQMNTPTTEMDFSPKIMVIYKIIKACGSKEAYDAIKKIMAILLDYLQRNPNAQFPIYRLIRRLAEEAWDDGHMNYAPEHGSDQASSSQASRVAKETNLEEDEQSKQEKSNLILHAVMQGTWDILLKQKKPHPVALEPHFFDFSITYFSPSLPKCNVTGAYTATAWLTKRPDTASRVESGVNLAERMHTLLAFAKRHGIPVYHDTIIRRAIALLYDRQGDNSQAYTMSTKDFIVDLKDAHAAFEHRYTLETYHVLLHVLLRDRSYEGLSSFQRKLEDLEEPFQIVTYQLLICAYTDFRRLDGERYGDDTDEATQNTINQEIRALLHGFSSIRRPKGHFGPWGHVLKAFTGDPLFYEAWECMVKRGRFSVPNDDWRRIFYLHAVTCQERQPPRLFEALSRATHAFHKQLEQFKFAPSPSYVEVNAASLLSPKTDRSRAKRVKHVEASRDIEMDRDTAWVATHAPTPDKPKTRLGQVSTFEQHIGRFYLYLAQLEDGHANVDDAECLLDEHILPNTKNEATLKATHACLMRLLELYLKRGDCLDSGTFRMFAWRVEKAGIPLHIFMTTALEAAPEHVDVLRRAYEGAQTRYHITSVYMTRVVKVLLAAGRVSEAMAVFGLLPVSLHDNASNPMARIPAASGIVRLDADAYHQLLLHAARKGDAQGMIRIFNAWLSTCPHPDRVQQHFSDPIGIPSSSTPRKADKVAKQGRHVPDAIAGNILDSIVLDSIPDTTDTPVSQTPYDDPLSKPNVSTQTLALRKVISSLYQDTMRASFCQPNLALIGQHFYIAFESGHYAACLDYYDHLERHKMFLNASLHISPDRKAISNRLFTRGVEVHGEHSSLSTWTPDGFASLCEGIVRNDFRVTCDAFQAFFLTNKSPISKHLPSMPKTFIERVMMSVVAMCQSDFSQVLDVLGRTIVLHDLQLDNGNKKRILKLMEKEESGDVLHLIWQVICGDFEEPTTDEDDAVAMAAKGVVRVYKGYEPEKAEWQSGWEYFTRIGKKQSTEMLQNYSSRNLVPQEIPETKARKASRKKKRKKRKGGADPAPQEDKNPFSKPDIQGLIHDILSEQPPPQVPERKTIVLSDQPAPQVINKDKGYGVPGLVDFIPNIVL